MGGAEFYAEGFYRRGADGEGKRFGMDDLRGKVARCQGKVARCGKLKNVSI
jgi:hypothetical protein